VSSRIGGEGPHGDLALQLLKLEAKNRLVEGLGPLQILDVNLYPGKGVSGPVRGLDLGD
jgi:hypothetical protein